MFNYNNISSKQLNDEKKYLTSSIFKLLPYKQENYKFLDNYFESVIQRLIGFNELVHQPELITTIALIEYARKENDFTKYRKAILDSCGIVQSIKVGDCDV